MSGKAFNAFLFRHLCFPFHSGNDQGLGYPRKGIFQVQGGCRPKTGADPWTAFIGNSQLIKLIHLFPDGSVNTWISRMKSYNAFISRLLHNLYHFFQRHLCAVINLTKTSPAAGFRFDKTPVEAQLAACQNVFETYGFPLENGGFAAADIDATIEAYQAALDEAGYQDVLAEFQAQYDAWKAQ